MLQLCLLGDIRLRELGRWRDSFRGLSLSQTGCRGSGPVASEARIFQAGPEHIDSVSRACHCRVESGRRRGHVRRREWWPHRKHGLVCFGTFGAFVIDCLAKLSRVWPRVEGEQECGERVERRLRRYDRDAGAGVLHALRSRDSDVAACKKEVVLSSRVVRGDHDPAPVARKGLRNLLFVAGGVAGSDCRESLRAVGHGLLARGGTIVAQVVVFGYVVVARLRLLVARFCARTLILGAGRARRDRLALAARRVAEEVWRTFLGLVVLRTIPRVVALVAAARPLCPVGVDNATWRAPAAERVLALHQALVTRQLRAALVQTQGAVGEQRDGHRGHRRPLPRHFLEKMTNARCQAAKAGEQDEENGMLTWLMRVHFMCGESFIL
eukprot:COSAG05_NODE_2080_length_3601_cov_1.988007_1_plen_382_part_00